MFDDLVFRNLYMQINGGTTDFSWQSMIDYAREVRANDNGRLSNILSPIATSMIPRWLFASITGIFVASMFALMCRIAGVHGRRTAYSLLLLWALSLVFLPWRNSLIVNDYLLNYVYSSVAILLFLGFNIRAVRGELSHPVEIIIAILIAFIAGWFHEGFSIPLLGALGLFALKKRFRLHWTWWLLIVVFALAAEWVLLAPGTMARADREVMNRSMTQYFKTVVTVLPAVGLLIGVYIFSGFVPKLRSITQNLLTKPAFFILTFATFFSAAIVMLVRPNPRVGWPAELYAMAALVAYLPYVSVRRGTVKFLQFGAGILFLGLCVFFANVIRWEFRFNRQHDEIMEQFSQSPTGTIFHDIINPRTVRLTTLFLPMRYEWITSFQYNIINDVDLGNTKYYAVVPEALADFPSEESKPIQGSGNLIFHCGVLVGPDGEFVNADEDKFSDEGLYDFYTSDGREYRGVECFRLRFKDKNGRWQMYVYPSSREIPGEIVRADYVGFF